MNFSALISHLHREVRTCRASDHCRIVAFTGHPYACKTDTANKLCGSFAPANSCVLPTESFIISREDRAERNLDGCSKEAYDIEGLRRAIESIRRGEQITVPIYSWQAGHVLDRRMELSAARNGLVIVDGTVSLCSELVNLYHAVFFFKPENSHAWIEHAVNRDIEERSWERQGAIAANLQKERTCAKLLAEFRCAISQIISVETIDSDGAAVPQFSVEA